MIRFLLFKQGQSEHGGEELLQRWQQDSEARLWIDLQGEEQASEAKFLAGFGIHPLAIADAQRHMHPPKVEAFDETMLMIFRGLTSIDSNLNAKGLNICFLVQDRLLITRHDSPARSIEHFFAQPPKEAHQSFLTLSLRLMHFSAGLYLEALLGFESLMNDTEEQMQEQGDDTVLKALMLYKTRLRRLVRVFNYHKAMMLELLESDLAQSDRDLNHHVTDVYERSDRVLGLCQLYYDICGDLIDGYLSISSHQLNNTMRVLTVVTAIFVPLGFLVGLYGMNFDHIPELHWRYGYFGLLALMATLASSLLWLFRRRKWL